MENKIKVFVLLYCFWEGDGYLVDGYQNCFISIEDCLEHISNKEKEREQSVAEGISLYTEYTPLKIYFPKESTPNENEGHWKSPGYFQIIEKEFIINLN